MRDLRVWRPEGLHWRVRPWLWLFFEPRHRFTCSQKPHCTCLFRNTAVPHSRPSFHPDYTRESSFQIASFTLGLRYGMLSTIGHWLLFTGSQVPHILSTSLVQMLKCISSLPQGRRFRVLINYQWPQERSADIGFLKGLEEMDFINEGCQIASASLSLLDRTYSW